MKITQERRAELRFDIDLYMDVAPAEITPDELSELLDMADQRDELLEAIDDIFEDGIWVGGEFIPSEEAKARMEATLTKVRGYA